MKESYWGYWLILLGILVVVVLMLVQSYTTTNTQDYYLIKEVTNAAMSDAIDYAYYRNTGEIRINKEKFVENFLRRFSETVNLNTTYKVDFYNLYEAPPKVTVKVTSSSRTFSIRGDSSTFESINKATAVLEQV